MDSGEGCEPNVDLRMRRDDLGRPDGTSRLGRDRRESDTRGQLAALAHAQLLENVVDVVLHSGEGDVQLLRNLLIGPATLNEINDLSFPVGQRPGLGDSHWEIGNAAG